MTEARRAGADISKDALDVCLYPGGQSGRFANDAKGHRGLVCWLAKHSIARVLYEATGANHRGFERCLAKPFLRSRPPCVSVRAAGIPATAVLS